jgi:hypothetical protein
MKALADAITTAGEAGRQRPNIERHLETFDTRTSLGGVEIWIALEDAGS